MGGETAGGGGNRGDRGPPRPLTPPWPGSRRAGAVRGGSAQARRAVRLGGLGAPPSGGAIHQPDPSSLGPQVRVPAVLGRNGGGCGSPLIPAVPLLGGPGRGSHAHPLLQHHPAAARRLQKPAGGAGTGGVAGTARRCGGLCRSALPKAAGAERG